MAPTSVSEKTDENVLSTLSREGYTLKQAVVLSRHNIRAPLSGEGSALDTITPNKWFEWSAPASQLSVRGGILETEMGQYFRKWLEAEGLFEPNYQPKDGAVRIYANSKQRTIATAQFFPQDFFLLPMQRLSTMQNMTQWILYSIRCSPICLTITLQILRRR